MNETMRNMLKVGVACFIGAVVLYVVALLLAPTFKFLCLLAGFGAGYFAYEFRKVLAAIPSALRTAWDNTKHLLVWLRKFAKEAWANALGMRPELWLAIILSIITVTLLFILFPDYGPTTKSHADISAAGIIMGYFIIYFMTYLVMGGTLATGIFVVIYILSAVGLGHYEIEVDSPRNLQAGWVYIDYNKLPIKERWKLCACSLYTAIGLMFYGIGWLLYKAAFWTVAFVFCYMWVWLAWGMYYALKAIVWLGKFLLAFVVNLVLAIHKKERLICAIDGTIGGIIAWMYLAPAVTASMADHILPMLCGGILGALVGMINYRLVSVALLKFLPARSEPASA